MKTYRITSHSKKLSIMLMLVVSHIAVLAQTTLSRVTGVVKGEDGRGIADVSVYVVAQGVQYAGKSDGNGAYEVRFERADTVTVGFRHINYDPKDMRIAVDGMKEIRRNVVLAECARQLEGITVESGTMHLDGSKATYIPTQRQVNGAYTGVALLFNMMIPQIDVSRINGTITAADDSRLGICIDGRETSAAEVAQLRAKDIARVEYEDNPTGIYSQYNKLVNIVTKKYTHGGYVDARSHERFVSFKENNTVNTSLDFGKVNLLATISSAYSTLDNTGSSSKEEFLFDSPFTKNSVIDGCKFRSHNESGALKATVRGEHYTLLVQGGLAWNRNPAGLVQGNTEYSGGAYPDSHYREDSRSRSLTPSLYIHHLVNMKNGQNFKWMLKYNYSDRCNEYSYDEDGMEGIYNKSTEDYHFAHFGMVYSKSFAHNNTLSLGMQSIYQDSRAHYGGSTPSVQRLRSTENIFSASYSQYLFNRLFLGLSVDADLKYYQTNGEGWTRDFSVSPSMNLYYRLTAKSSLNMSVSYSTITPQMSILNGATVTVSPFECRRGNPGLDLSQFSNARLSYSLYMGKNVTLSAYVSHDGYYGYAKRVSFVEDGMMVTSFAKGGDYHSCHFGADASLKLSANLTAKLGGRYTNAVVTDVNAMHGHWFFAKSSLYYTLGKFSLSGELITQQNGMNSDYRYKYLSRYGIMASWSHRGFFAEVGCKQFFNKGKCDVNMYDFGAKNLTERICRKDNDCSVYVNLSYSFDFGRKIKHESIQVEQGRSGLLSY